MTLHRKMRELGIRGTLLLAPEGINAGYSGPPEPLDAFTKFLIQEIGISPPVLKVSWSEKIAFSRALVKIKKHIVPPPGSTKIDLATDSAPYLAPEELHQWIESGKKMVLLDTRNGYEFQLGRFSGSQHLGTRHFSKFENDLKHAPEEWKTMPVVTFCTGGIRCEKAAPLMLKKGFREVYQLDGGILNYFEKVGRGHFEGGCFVFDKRVALDEKLLPTGDVMCFACQAILKPEEVKSPQFKEGAHCPHCISRQQTSNKKNNLVL